MRGLNAIKADMKSILYKAQADGRDLNQDEVAAFDKLKVEANEAKARAAKAYEANSFFRELAAIQVTDGVDGPADPEARPASGASYGAKAVAKMASQANGMPLAKALLSGGLQAPAALDVVATLPDVPTSVLDLFPRIGLANNNQFAYLRQVKHTAAAAVVADGAAKPVSEFEFTEVEDRCRVIAAMVHDIPVRYLGANDLGTWLDTGRGDFPELARILDVQLKHDIMRALELQTLTGDGTGENMTGLLTTSGIGQSAFSTDAITSLRKAWTQLVLKGETPTALVLSAQDYESLELLRENGATGGFLLDGESLGRIAKAPVVLSPVLEPGQAILGDFNQAAVVVREDASVIAATQAGDDFDKNLVRLRSEGRYGFQVLRPSAFTVVDLTA